MPYNQPVANRKYSLDSPFCVFYGDQHEAEPVQLAGTLVLNASDNMNIRSIKIKLTGKWKAAWSVSGNAAAAMGASSNGGQVMIKDSGKLVEDEQLIFPASSSQLSAMSSTHRIAAGKHEWRFQFTLDPSLPESIEGLQSGFVGYELKAEIDRGYMSKGLLAKKHVRIIRTLSRDMTETVPFPYVSVYLILGESD
jgi:arrestin-related trafficking adapter 4/5/7